MKASRFAPIALSLLVLFSCGSQADETNNQYSEIYNTLFTSGKSIQFYDLAFDLPAITINEKYEFIQSKADGIPSLEFKAGYFDPTTPKDVIPPIFHVVITQDQKSYSRLADFLSNDRCDPRFESDSTKKINHAYAFSQITTLPSNPGIELIHAINNCNFPGGLRKSYPVETVSCIDSEIYSGQSDHLPEYCPLMIELGYANPPDYKIENHPLVFENDEYVLRVHTQIYRIRKLRSWSNTAKADTLLREILMNSTVH